MMTIQLTNTDFLPSESSYFEPPVVSITDCMRLRQYPLSDELTDELDRAIVVHPEHIPDDVVTMYARCAYIDERTGMRREIELVYPDEADPGQGKISVLTPVGSALLGLAIGDEITWPGPGGQPLQVSIIEIVYQPERELEFHR